MCSSLRIPPICLLVALIVTGGVAVIVGVSCLSTPASLLPRVAVALANLSLFCSIFGFFVIFIVGN